MGGGSSKKQTTAPADPKTAPGSPPTTGTSTTTLPPPTEPAVKKWHHILSFDPTYSVEFPPEGSFGIGLMSPIEQDQRVYVKSLVKGGFAEAGGKIRHGDMLVKINDVDVSLLTMNQILIILRDISKSGTNECRVLGFYSRDNLELYSVKMSKSPEAGPFGARIINSHYGTNNIAVVVSIVKKGGQAEKLGVLAGDSILKIGEENIHTGSRAGLIIKDAQSDTLMVYMCRGMKMGERVNGKRVHLASETEEESKKFDEEFDYVIEEDEMDMLTQDLQNSMIDELQNETDVHEAALKKATSKKQARMSNRIQERLQGRKMLKESPESLKKTDLFNDLENDVIAKIVDAMQFKTIPSGQNLMTQGEFASEAMVILKGDATVLHDAIEVKKCMELDCLGEGSLVAGDHVRGATVRADTKLHVLVLTRDQFNLLSTNSILPPTTAERAKAMAKKYEESDEERLKKLMTGRVKYTVKYNKGTLGMKLVCLSQKDSRVFVKSVVAGGQSEQNGQVCPGHQIIAIANHEITKMKLEDVLKKIASTKKPVSITFAADDVAGIGASAANNTGSGISDEWISFMGDGEDETELTFAEVTAKNEDIVARIQEEQEKNLKIQQEKRQKQQQLMAERVQQRLKARASLKNAKCLSKCVMFEGFDTEILSAIVDCMELRQVSDGQNIVTQGDDAREMFVITSGKCKVFVGENEVREFAKLDCIGEKAIDVGDHIRGATVTAFDGNVQCLVLSRLKWNGLHTSGIIKADHSSGIMKNARTISKRYSKVDAARMASMVNNGEAIDEGVTSSI